MAEVFLCKLVGIGGFEKHVVIKKIKEDIASDSEFITMFFDEARLAANLNHPNIIQVFEVDQLDGTPYIAMEYVRGSTLSGVMQKLRAGQVRFDLGHLAFIFAGVCAGLDHAHHAVDAAGRPLSIVHRDISPQNIIVSLDGTPKIFDFGVAKARGSLSLTGADRVKGKFAYMAPEQLRAQHVDAKADVFAVGVCMYEAVTGKRPFGGSTEAELFARRLEGRFAMPSELAPDLPVELEHLILSAMAPDPADRPTAVELQQQLADFCGVGSERPSSALAIAAWLKELLPQETEAYANYSTSSPSLGSVPRSANLPPTSGAVEAHRARLSFTSRITIGALSVAALALAAVVVVALVHRGDGAPQVASGAAGTDDSASRALADERERQHRAELERMRVQLEEVKRAQEAAAAAAPAAAAPAAAPAAATMVTAAEPAPVERTVERTNDRTVDRAAKKKVVTPRVAVTTKAAMASKPTSVGSGSGSALGSGAGSGQGATQGSAQGSAQVAAQVPAPSAPPAPISAPVGAGSGSARTGSAPAPVKITAQPAPSPVAIASPGTLDAIPAFSKLAVDGSLTTTEVQSALGRTVDTLRSCYRGAAKKANQTPDISLRVSFEIDEGARAGSVRIAGDTLGLAGCVKDAIGGVRTRVAPDVGTVSVSAVVRFKPTH